MHAEFSSNGHLYRTILSDWLATMDMNYFVTFNFNHDETLCSGRTALKRFHAKLDRKCFGSGFHKRCPNERTLFLAFPEHLNSNLHYHALVRTPSPLFCEYAPDIWQNIVPAGQLHISHFRNKMQDSVILGKNDPNIQRIARYITKEAFREKNFNGFIISSEFSNA